MQTQVPCNLTLPVSIFLNSLSHLLVTFSFIPEYALLKYFFECRSICVPLTPGYLGYMLVFLQVIGKAVYEFVFAQDDLPFDIQPDGFFADSPFDELTVFSFCLVSFPAELPEYPVRGKAGVGLFFACGGKVAAPFPLIEAFCHSCPKGI